MSVHRGSADGSHAQLHILYRAAHRSEGGLDGWWAVARGYEMEGRQGDGSGFQGQRLPSFCSREPDISGSHVFSRLLWILTFISRGGPSAPFAWEPSYDRFETETARVVCWYAKTAADVGLEGE